MSNMQKTARREERHRRRVAKRAALLKARNSDDPITADEIRGAVQQLTDEPVEVVVEEVFDEPDPVEVEGESDDDESDDIPSEEDAPRDPDDFAGVGVKKDMYGTEGIVQPTPMGPTSWDELDAAKAAQEQAHEIEVTSYNVEDLVRNILNHPMMDASEKATAIQGVGAGFQDRVDAILSADNPEDLQKDIELLELEALIAYDNRHTPVAERMGDWISKAKLSYAAKKAKPDSAYALVTTRGGVKVRKYLIHDKAHVRNALARAAQQIKGGGVGAADAKAALPKIRAAAKRMGIGMMAKEAASAIMLQKDAKGEWRWVGWPSNNFKDLQGDIISKEAHQEFVQFLDANPDMAPKFMTWHTPGTERDQPADYWHFENGFLIMSGVLSEAEAGALFKAQAATDLGMSMQGFGLRESNDPRVITKYRAFEVSDLPLDHAANPFTDFSVIVKEVDMDKKAYLATLLGSPEKAEAYLAKAGLKQQALDAAGIESKSTDGKTVVVNNVTAPAAPKPDEKLAKAVAQAQAKPNEAEKIVELVFKEMGIEELNAFVTEAQAAMEKIPILEGVIKEMQGNHDQELADKITPPAAKFAWMRKEKASTADETKVTDDDPLARKAPGLGENWLSEVTGTTPIQVEEIRA